MLTDMTLDELIENFSLFDDWEERYRYLIELGEKLPPLPEEGKTDDTLVKGCMSQVWMTVDVTDDQHLMVRADSDATIVKGLIAVLVIIYDGLAVDKISDIDMDGVFARLGLDQHLSPNRRNGFYSMVERIRTLGQVSSTSHLSASS